MFNDGGPAFPCLGNDAGMSLHDYVAARAPKIILALYDPETLDLENIAKLSLDYADAFMAERERRIKAQAEKDAIDEALEGRR